MTFSRLCRLCRLCNYTIVACGRSCTCPSPAVCRSPPSWSPARPPVAFAKRIRLQIASLVQAFCSWITNLKRFIWILKYFENESLILRSFCMRMRFAYSYFASTINLLKIKKNWRICQRQIIYFYFTCVVQPGMSRDILEQTDLHSSYFLM